MKTTRLVVGIISIVLFLVVAFQSCAAGIGNTLADNGEGSGSAGGLLGFAYFRSGTQISRRRNNSSLFLHIGRNYWYSKRWVIQRPYGMVCTLVYICRYFISDSYFTGKPK